jgi:hypothetical protein
MRLIPADLLAMTGWHLGLLVPALIPAWWALTAVPAVRRWMRGRLNRD